MPTKISMWLESEEITQELVKKIVNEAIEASESNLEYASVITIIITISGLMFGLYKFYDQWKERNTIRYTELLMNSSKEMNQVLNELLSVKESNILIRKLCEYLDVVDKAVYLSNQKKIPKNLIPYFDYDIALAMKIIEWLDVNHPPKNQTRYYATRWCDIVNWIQENDKERKIPISEYDLPLEMRS